MIAVATDGWFVNIPRAVGFIAFAHHLTPSRSGAWKPTALCGEEGRAWQAVKLNPCLERVPRCPKCSAAGAEEWTAEASTEQREQLQPPPPREHRSPQRRVYRRVVI